MVPLAGFLFRGDVLYVAETLRTAGQTISMLKDLEHSNRSCVSLWYAWLTKYVTNECGINLFPSRSIVASRIVETRGHAYHGSIVHVVWRHATVVQVQGAQTVWQSLLHPSSSSVLPSSQVSSDAWTPSPQNDMHALGSAVPQSKPHSTVHVDEQPSSLMVLPSSQVSSPCMMPSPHVSPTVVLPSVPPTWQHLTMWLGRPAA